MITPRSQIIAYIEQGIIKEEYIDDALTVLNIAPDGKSWRTFIDNLLLWLGALALTFAVLFFIAYNWSEIGNFAKFGLVEGLMILSIIAYYRSKQDAITGQVSLVAASILLGVLLALYGQTYQTGADGWQLFFNWAMLMLPWALIGRFPAIWIIWVALINITIVLYFQTFMHLFWMGYNTGTDMLWMVFIFNTLVLVSWELLAGSWHWLSERWAIRLLGVGSGIPLTSLALDSIFESRNVTVFPLLAWIAWLVALYFIYRKVRFDLFMLAGGCLSGIVVTISFLSEHILKSSSSGAFLLLALAVIGMGSGAALWLKNIHQEVRHD